MAEFFRYALFAVLPSLFSCLSLNFIDHFTSVCNLSVQHEEAHYLSCASSAFNPSSVWTVVSFHVPAFIVLGNERTRSSTSRSKWIFLISSNSEILDFCSSIVSLLLTELSFYVLSSAALLMPSCCLTYRLPSSSFQSLPVLPHCFESSVLVTPGLLPDGSFNSVTVITFSSFCNPAS